VRAVILAGGKGSRLRPYTTVLPKPLVPVGERPILELILRQLARDGFTRVDLAVGHLGGLIQAYFSDDANCPPGMDLTYHWEKEPLGTAGALHQVEGLDDAFLVMNGDVLTTLSFADLMRFHRDNDAALTIATKLRDHQVQLGVIEADERLVTGYVEKPTLSYRVSIGVYVYEPRVLDHMPRGYSDFPDVVHTLVAAGERVMVYHFDGRWFDIGTFAEHELALTELEHSAADFSAGL
jgi:NDP-mannose synthase